jgi:hypothetical protein
MPPSFFMAPPELTFSASWNILATTPEREEPIRPALSGSAPDTPAFRSHFFYGHAVQVHALRVCVAVYEHGHGHDVVHAVDPDRAQM